MSDKEKAESNKDEYRNAIAKLKYLNKTKKSKRSNSMYSITLIIMSISLLFYFSLKLLIEAYVTSLNIASNNNNISVSFSLNDSFIGIIAALIGVMVTFVIGYQILNAIQIKEDVDYIKKDVLSKVEHIQVDFKTLESKLQYDIATSNLDTSLDLNNVYELYDNNDDTKSIINLMFALKQFFNSIITINDTHYIKRINNYISIKSNAIELIIRYYILNKNNIENSCVNDDFFDDIIKH